MSLSDLLQAIYVCLTLIIAMIAVRSYQFSKKALAESNRQAEKTLAENNRQAEKALAESNRQAEKALSTLYLRIEENRRQAKDRIDAVYDEIEQNKKLTDNTIFNQHRPVLVCKEYPPKVKDAFLITIRNVGSGVATNICVVLSFISSETYRHFNNDLPALFMNEEHECRLERGNKPNPNRIEDYTFLPKKEKEGNGIVYIARIVMTYSDIFNRKHLSIFDSDGKQAWKQVTIKSGIVYAIDEKREN